MTKIYDKDMFSIGFYSAQSGIPLPTRLRMLINARQSEDKGCYLSKKQMAAFLGCEIQDIKQALIRGRKAKTIEKITWGDGRTGYQVKIPISDSQLEGMNSISSRMTFCRTEEKEGLQLEQREKMDRKKIWPSVYAANDLDSEVLELLSEKDHWVSLHNLWDDKRFQGLLDLSDRQNKTWWLSLVSNLRKNSEPWAKVQDDDLLVQIGMLHLADHLRRKDEPLKARDVRGLVCKILQTLNKKNDRFTLTDPELVAQDMEIMSEYFHTIRENKGDDQ